MKNLYCPWRSSYSSDDGRSKQEDATSDECVFCAQIKAHEDPKHLILKRFKHHIVMLNKYPYNAGHLLILPLEHYADLSQLSPEAQHELIELTTRCSTLLKKELHAHGINIGMNLGKAAGAGIPSHLHMHILPRFQGDTNFMPTIAETKNVSFDLHKLYEQLRKTL